METLSSLLRSATDPQISRHLHPVTSDRPPPPPKQRQGPHVHTHHTRAHTPPLQTHRPLFYMLAPLLGCARRQQQSVLLFQPLFLQPLPRSPPAEGLKVITSAVHFISMRTKAARGMHYHFTEKRQRAVCPLVYARAFGHFLQTAAAAAAAAVSRGRRCCSGEAGQNRRGQEEENSQPDKDEIGIARRITRVMQKRSAAEPSAHASVIQTHNGRCCYPARAQLKSSSLQRFCSHAGDLNRFSAASFRRVLDAPRTDRV